MPAKNDATSFAEKDHFYATVGDMVKKYRHDAGFSREKLAVQADLNISTIATCEDGRNVTLLALAKIAEALDCTLDDLCPLAALEVECSPA